MTENIVSNEPNTNTETIPEIAKKPKKRLAPTIFGLLLFLLISIGFFAYKNYLLRKQVIVNTNPTSDQSGATPTSQTPPPQATAAEQINSTYDVSLDVSTWKSFTSPSLNFTFNYPSEWGEVKEEIEDAVQEGTGDSGKTYRLTFIGVDYENSGLDGLVFGSGRSADYSASRGGMDTDYAGIPSEPKGVKATVWARPTECIIPVSSHLYFGRIDFNLPGKEISGVRLLMPVISQDQVKVFDVEYEAKTEQEKEAFCLWENVEKEASQYISQLEAKQLDELSQKQLLVFKEILKSSKVLN